MGPFGFHAATAIPLVVFILAVSPGISMAALADEPLPVPSTRAITFSSTPLHMAVQRPQCPIDSSAVADRGLSILVAPVESIHDALS